LRSRSPCSCHVFRFNRPAPIDRAFLPHRSLGAKCLARFALLLLLPRSLNHSLSHAHQIFPTTFIHVDAVAWCARKPILERTCNISRVWTRRFDLSWAWRFDHTQRWTWTWRNAWSLDNTFSTGYCPTATTAESRTTSHRRPAIPRRPAATPRLTTTPRLTDAHGLVRSTAAQHLTEPDR
jgi:hypothetical protein